MSATTYTITLTPTNDELLINQQGQATPQQIELYFGALIKGDKGDTGNTGPQGPTGATGATGPQGPQGQKGDTGQTGATGAQGPAGADGANGQDGVGISSVALNADYTLTITLTNGTSYTTSSIRGAQGPQGVQGNTGATGNGIASTVLNADYTLTITFTDGTSYTTSPIRGAQGEEGQPGQDGEDGQDGAPGPNQVNTTTDTNITGLLKGSAGKVAQAAAGADYVAPESGKGLSSNDYTNAEKTKLAGLNNYDDTALSGRVSVIEGKESGWDAKGTYSKPSGGIPSSDMSVAVQTSLGKADTAIQSHQSLAAYRTAAEQDAMHDVTKVNVSDDELSANAVAAALCQLAERLDLHDIGVFKNGIAAYTKDFSTLLDAVQVKLDANEDVIASALVYIWDNKASIENLAPAYTGYETYAVGDVRTANNKLWKCVSAISAPEPFNAAHWQQTTIVDIINDR